MSENAIIDSAMPLFPLGTPRSGTTILARILNAHPEILMTDETSAILQLSENIMKSRRGRKSGVAYGRSYNELWAECLSLQAKSLIEGFYEEICKIEGKEKLVYWGEKHPHHSHGDCLEFINHLYPEAKYIYIVRDPRDVALSIAKMNSIPFSDAMKAWKKYTDKYESYFHTLDENLFFLSAYEDLVSDYKGKTKEILKWLNLPYAEETDNFIDAFSGIDVHAVSKEEWRQSSLSAGKSFDFVNVNNEKNWFKDLAKQVLGIKERTKKDFKSKSVNKWKNDLTKREKKYALELAGDYIDRYGYQR